MVDSKTVLVLGGGIGGIAASSILRRRLPRAHRVVLVERETRYVFPPSLLWLMVGARREHKISRPLSLNTQLGVELLHGEINQIDPPNKSVCVDDKTIAADYVVVALGAELAPDAVPGLADAGHNFYTLAGAKSLRQARTDLSRGRIVVLVGAIPFKCPAAPYEAAMLLAADARKRRVRENVTIDLYTPEPGPMLVAGPQVSAKVLQMVEAAGVTVHTDHAITEVDPSGRLLHFGNGATAPFDLLAYVPPHRAPEVVRASSLVAQSGWVKVDPQTLETDYPGVYAIGDVTGIPLAMGKPLPKAGVFAHGEAKVVANNIAHAITGKGAPRRFDGHGSCFIEIGGGRAGFGSGNFFAEPAPEIRLRRPSRLLHLGKVAYEKFWLNRLWF